MESVFRKARHVVDLSGSIDHSRAYHVEALKHTWDMLGKTSKHSVSAKVRRPMDGTKECVLLLYCLMQNKKHLYAEVFFVFTVLVASPR